MRLIGIEGRVTVTIDVDKNGDVQNVRLAESSGNLELDEAFITQVIKWKFKPSAYELQSIIIGALYSN